MEARDDPRLGSRKEHDRPRPTTSSRGRPVHPHQFFLHLPSRTHITIPAPAPTLDFLRQLLCPTLSFILAPPPLPTSPPLSMGYPHQYRPIARIPYRELRCRPPRLLAQDWRAHARLCWRGSRRGRGPLHPCVLSLRSPDVPLRPRAEAATQQTRSEHAHRVFVQNTPPLGCSGRTRHPRVFERGGARNGQMDHPDDPGTSAHTISPSTVFPPDLTSCA